MIGRETWVLDLIKTHCKYYGILKQLQPLKILKRNSFKKIVQTLQHMESFMIYPAWPPDQFRLFSIIFTGTWQSSLAGASSCLRYSGVRRLVEHKIHSDSTWGLTHNAWKEQMSSQRDRTLNCGAAADYLCCLSKLFDLLAFGFPIKKQNKTNKQKPQWQLCSFQVYGENEWLRTQQGTWKEQGLNSMVFVTIWTTGNNSRYQTFYLSSI